MISFLCALVSSACVGLLVYLGDYPMAAGLALFNILATLERIKQ